MSSTENASEQITVKATGGMYGELDRVQFDYAVSVTPGTETDGKVELTISSQPSEVADALRELERFKAEA